MSKIIDWYLDNSLLSDLLIILLIVFCDTILPEIILFKFDIIVQSNILNSLIGTSVSLAGFILAALTIIVSFRSNIACKKPEDAGPPLELIFSTDNYHKIINVFKSAIIELTMAFVGLYIVWILSENLTPEHILQANVYGGLLIFLSLVRTLFILFLVLKMDKKSKNE